MSLRSLEAKQNLVSTTPEQIGLSWDHLPPRMRPAARSRPHRFLADVLELSGEGLNSASLKRVLSLETWNDCLSDSEKEQLYRFLPETSDPESLVAALLNCENFHFESPLSSWIASVLDGSMHPDTLVAEKKRISRERKAYQSTLRTYHHTLIEDLKDLKSLSSNCSSQEKLGSVIQMWMNSRGRKENSGGPKQLKTKIKKDGGKTNEISDDWSLGQRVKRRRAAGVESSTDEWLKKHGNGNGWDGTELLTVKVRKEQFRDIVSKRQNGEEVRLDALKDVGPSEIALRNGCAAGDLFLKSHWRVLVQVELPRVYQAFIGRLSERRRLATSFARQCARKTHADQNGTSTNNHCLASCSKRSAVDGYGLPLIEGDELLKHQNGVRDSLLLGTAPDEEDELASIQELFSCRYLESLNHLSS